MLRFLLIFFLLSVSFHLFFLSSCVVIAGLFTVFSSFIFTSSIINFLGSEVSDLKWVFTVSFILVRFILGDISISGACVSRELVCMSWHLLTHKFIHFFPGTDSRLAALRWWCACYHVRCACTEMPCSSFCCWSIYQRLEYLRNWHWAVQRTMKSSKIFHAEWRYSVRQYRSIRSSRRWWLALAHCRVFIVWRICAALP